MLMNVPSYFFLQTYSTLSLSRATYYTPEHYLLIDVVLLPFPPFKCGCNVTFLRVDCQVGFARGFSHLSAVAPTAAGGWRGPPSPSIPFPPRL